MSRKRGPSTRLMFVLIALLIAVAASQFYNGYTNERGDKETAQTKATHATTAKDKAEATTQVVKDSGRDLADQVLAACAGSGKEAKALRAAALCGQATQTKTEITKAAPGATGATGARGPGPTFLQVLTAVRQLIDEALARVCNGTCTGASGADGKDSTVAGPQGATGTTGKDGKDSTVPGPAGPTGPAGADGKDGAAGSDGRGIADAQCGDDDRWLITYTDGSTSDGGTCRTSLLPTP